MDHDIFTIGLAGTGAGVGTVSGVGVGLGAGVGVGVWRGCRSRARAFPTTASFSCLQLGRGVTGCSKIPFALIGTTVFRPAPLTLTPVHEAELGLQLPSHPACCRREAGSIHPVNPQSPRVTSYSPVCPPSQGPTWDPGNIDQSSRPLWRVSLGLRETTTGTEQIGPGSHTAARRSLTAFGSESCPRPTTGLHKAITSSSHLYRR